MARGICIVKGCGRPRHGQGLCDRCYAQWRRGTLSLAIQIGPAPKPKPSKREIYEKIAAHSNAAGGPMKSYDQMRIDRQEKWAEEKMALWDAVDARLAAEERSPG
jgi:hypothetical protein